MPTSLRTLTNLWHSIKEHLVRRAPAAEREHVAGEYDGWRAPFETVLEGLWNKEGEVGTMEKEDVVNELRALDEAASAGRVTVRNLPTLASRSFLEVATVFCLSPYALNYYLHSLSHLFLWAPDAQLEASEAWLDRALEEERQLQAGWERARLATKMEAVKELARRYEVIASVRPEQRSAHVLTSLFDHGIFPVLASLRSAAPMRSLGSAHYGRQQHHGRAAALTTRQRAVYGEW
ncbi:hypothetical protein JCM6882_009376 [Rhodosporidiobolus microsporus]